jgi:rsbT co-antagonist protein RsbR
LLTQETTPTIPQVLKKFERDILADWIAEQEKTLRQKIKSAELNEQCQDFLRLFIQATHTGHLTTAKGAAWEPVQALLAKISRARTMQGFSPSETATFVFSLKQPLFKVFRREHEANPTKLFEEIWTATNLLDDLGLYTTEIYQKSREEVILRQQEEMLELSTPVVKLWDGILALPLIGTLDSSRTQVVMESLLHKIVETGSEIAIIDITGVPTVDTLVAQHLMKTVTAARLMGAECIISGIRPQIAATIVHLGVDLSNITTKASLADAFLIGLAKSGRYVTRKTQQPQSKTYGPLTERTM